MRCASGSPGRRIPCPIFTPPCRARQAPIPAHHPWAATARGPVRGSRPEPMVAPPGKIDGQFDPVGGVVEPDILAYYNQGREQARLESIGRLEFLRTQELLHRYLPRPPAAVLDIGGGAGIHALPLLAEGYTVTLIDPVELHVEQARAAGVADAVVGDARHLQLADGVADAVVLLGPLYHLTEEEDRVEALAEARRVTRGD